jgi:hypothetical protein
LKDGQTGAGSSGLTANIFPPALNTRSFSHCTCSVALGRAMQKRRTHSLAICPSGFAAPNPAKLLFRNMKPFDRGRGAVRYAEGLWPNFVG